MDTGAKAEKNDIIGDLFISADILRVHTVSMPPSRCRPSVIINNITVELGISGSTKR